MDTDRFSIAPGDPEKTGPGDALKIRESRVVVDPTETIDFYQINLQLARQLETRSENPVQAVLQGILTLLGAETLCFEDRCSAAGPMRRWVHRQEHSPWAASMEAEAEQQLEQMGDARRTRLYPCAFRENLFVLTAPLRVMGKSAGSVVVFLDAPSEAELQPFTAIFQASLGFLVGALLLGDLRGVEENVRDSAAWIEMTGKALRAPFPERALQQLLDEIKGYLGCAHLIVGTADRRGSRVRGMAGLAHFERKGSLISLMEESLAEVGNSGGGRVMISRAEAAEGSPGKATALFELCRAIPGTSVLGLGLRHEAEEEDRAKWRVIAMWSAPEVPARSQRFLEALRPQLGGVLEAVDHTDPLRIRKWMYLGWTRLEEQKRTWMRAAAALLGVLLILPVPLRITADARLEPSLRRVVSARYEGTLMEARVRPGDRVEAGDLLARLDDVELLLREAEMTASRERAERRRDLAMTDPGTPVASARMAQLELEALELDLALLAEQKAALELRAPISGMVMAGDLDRAIGVPVQKGQMLFEIAPEGAMRVEVLVPAHEIAQVRTGMPMRLRLQSFPGQEWSSEVSRIAPRSDQTRGKNLFVVEALLEASEEDAPLRAGMVGRATLRGRRVPLIWALIRRLVDFIRVTLFW